MTRYNIFNVFKAFANTFYRIWPLGYVAIISKALTISFQAFDEASAKQYLGLWQPNYNIVFSMALAGIVSLYAYVANVKNGIAVKGKLSLFVAALFSQCIG